MSEIQNGFVGVPKQFSWWYPTNILASVGPSGEPVTTPSFCLYIVFLKLNSTHEVAAISNSV